MPPSFGKYYYCNTSSNSVVLHGLHFALQFKNNLPHLKTIPLNIHYKIVLRRIEMVR